jgi:hypothetical protein
MFLKIKLPTQEFLVEATNAPAIIAAIGSIKCFDYEGWGDERKAIISEHQPEITFVREDFLTPPPEPLVKLSEQKRYADTQWLQQYNEANAAKKEVAELKAKLAEIQAKVNAQ